MPRMRWTLDQKKHHVAAWRASGLTREQYCELYDIPFKSLRQWPQMSQKQKSGPEHQKLFLFLCLVPPVWMMADHCQMTLSRSSCPGGSGCAASLLS